jgi:predicted nucleotidyltransferase component of viral defense system
VLEKDIWVCWALQALFSMPNAHPMAFKGGTSLSKVYGVIDRFSEDVDITLDYRAFEEDFDPFAEEVSRTETKQFSERLKSYVSDYANYVVAPHLKNESAKLPTADQHTVEVDGGGEKTWITYPSVVEVIDEYIRSQVLGGRNVNDAMSPSARTHL